MKLTASRTRLEGELRQPEFLEMAASLEALGITEITVIGRARGGTSVCYFLRTDGDHRDLVFKRPEPGENFGDEYQLLSSAEHAGGLAMRLPRPVSLLPDGIGYVMTRLPGTRLPDSPLLRARAGHAALAGKVLASVCSFHAALGRPYGDLHARNVLIDGAGAIGFIDPGHSTDLHAAIAQWPAVEPLANDLGLWVYNTCLDGPAALLRSPAAYAEAVRFAGTLVTAAAGAENDPPGFLNSVFGVATRHARRLWRSPWPAQRARAPFVTTSLHVLRWRAVRQLRSDGPGEVVSEP